VNESDPAPGAEPLAGLRIAVVYDCLFPWTLGGAERWYRALAEGLVAAGADVRYLTRTQWDAGAEPVITGVSVIAVSPAEALYSEDGTRKLAPPLHFGWGVLRWMLAHRNELDAVHLANFPFFSLLATRLALVATPVRVSVDWHEVWPWRFWRSYAGSVGGAIGYVIQELCVRLTPQAFSFLARNDERLRAHGLRGPSTVLAGLLPTIDRVRTRVIEPPEQKTALFVGRHIKDKGLRLLPEAIALARHELPELRLVVAGEGPDTPYVRDLVESLGLVEAVEFVGRVSDDALDALSGSASCIVVASVREGYGIVAPEAAGVGTPAVVVDNPENAASSHIIDGVNGYVVEPTAAGIASGIVRCVRAGRELRERTAAWFDGTATGATMNLSVASVVQHYSAVSAS